jgi:hypothetical protein
MLQPYSSFFEALEASDLGPNTGISLRNINPLLSRRLVETERVICGALRLYEARALAHLHAGESEMALKDVRAGLKLAGFLEDQRVLHYVGVRALAMAGLLQPLWEGMQSGEWSAEQLKALQSDLEGLNPLRQLGDELRFQRVVHADFVEAIVPTRAGSDDASAPSLPRQALSSIRWVRRLYPRGWSLLDQAAIHSFYLGLDPMSGGTDEAYVQPERELARSLMRSSSDPCFAIFLVPRVVQMSSEAREYLLFAEAAVRLGTTACAIERFHLTTGEYPQTTGVLVPELMTSVPRDPVNGEALRYHRTDAGYGLYSVCLDGEDNGGAYPPPDRFGLRGVQPGWDWVWSGAKR